MRSGGAQGGGGRSSRRKEDRGGWLPPAPKFVQPMTAREVTELPDSNEWLYEIKLDGYRGFGIKHGNTTRLVSRKDKNLGEDFPRHC